MSGNPTPQELATNAHKSRLSPASPSRPCHDMDDEKTNGRRACPAVADSHGLDAWRIAVQPDQSRNCGRSFELCAELPLPQPCKEHVAVGIGRGCSDLVAAIVLSGDSVQGAILVVVVFRGIGTLRVRHSGDA